MGLSTTSRSFLRYIITFSVLSLTCGSQMDLNMTFNPEQISEMYEDDEVTVYYNISCDYEMFSLDNITFTVTSQDEDIAKTGANGTVALSGPCSAARGSFSVIGVRLGRGEILVTLQDTSVDVEVYRTSYLAIILRRRTLVDDIFRYGIICMAAILYIGFGCKVRMAVIKKILKKPIAPLIGQLCQFIIMPLIGFALGQAFNLDESLAFGLLIMACSPGGGSSNVWVNLLDGDLDLSITMTTLSTFLSLAMMPLWVYALGRYYLPPSRVDIPYVDLVRSLLTIVAPLAVGLIIRHFLPKVADKIAWFTRPWSGIFVVYVLGFGTYVNWYMYEIMGTRPVEVIPSSILLPLTGYILAFALALLARRTWKEAVTISIETGVQNASIPIIVLQGSFPQPEGDLAAVMPVSTALFYTIPILIAWFIYLIYKRLHPEDSDIKDPESADNEAYDDAGDKHKHSLNSMTNGSHVTTGKSDEKIDSSAF